MRMMYKGDNQIAFTDDNGQPSCVLAYCNDNVIARGKIVDDWSSSIVINTKNLQIVQQDVGLIIDISDDVLSQVSSIEINGFKFIKEK